LIILKEKSSNLEKVH